MSAFGAVLGIGVALGGWLVWQALPWRQRTSLATRIAPFVRRPAGPSFASPADESFLPRELARLSGVAQPLLAHAAALLDRYYGGTRSVRRRLAAVGSPLRVEAFRIEQVVWSVAGGLAGALMAGFLATVSERMSLLAAAILLLTGLLTGVLARDWWLSMAVRRAETVMLAEFPIVAELLALAVTAGEAPVSALERVCRVCRGELSTRFQRALADARTGASLPAALRTVADQTSLDALARFVDGILIALERGTPLAEVLRAQAADVRQASKRSLLASGGRRELAMLLPVVFIILPITVVFALFPGLVAITVLTR